MTLASKFSYQRLKHEGEFEEEEDEEQRGIRKIRSWTRFRKLTVKKRPKIRIPGLRKFLRKKDKFLSAVRVSMKVALKKLKDNQTHMFDLFAGHYLFMQVTPAPFKCVGRSFLGHDDLHGLSSRKLDESHKLVTSMPPCPGASDAFLAAEGVSDHPF
ncbi:hypothetical protein F0562_024337 [Nyssa sinensis]|uniref:Uncharacterized protein n=1 Tax=Nyssa sinensis TaxID=561372 RepID=A0A5J5BDK9_9ASTE|nr:hypothetical protein F0562_024337 [Nyssa sinensis]